MGDPRIEIAARALRQIEHMLGVALSDAEHGSGPDHDPGQIMCDAMGDARELAFEAYQATFDAARPEVDGDVSDERLNAALVAFYGPDMKPCGPPSAPFWEYPKDYRDAMRRALTAARTPAAPDAWQPIETAPRDSTDILVYWHKSEFFGIISWSDGRWEDEEGRDVGGMLFWQPLPKPPINAPKDAKP